MVRSGFFNSVNQDRVYNADDFGVIFGDVFTNGVVYEAHESLQVVADTGMNILVLPGHARIKGVAMWSDDAIPFTLASPDGQNPRMDRVVLRHDKDARSIDVFLLQGTPSSTPAAPELTRGDVVYELSLATITVGASVGAIAQEDITDTRNVPNVCGLSRVHSFYVEGQPDTEAMWEYIEDRLNSTKILTIVDYVYWGVLYNTTLVAAYNRWEIRSESIRGDKEYLFISGNMYYQTADKYPPIPISGAVATPFIPYFQVAGKTEGRVLLLHNVVADVASSTLRVSIKMNMDGTVNATPISMLASYRQAINGPLSINNAGYSLNLPANYIAYRTPFEFKLLELN